MSRLKLRDLREVYELKEGMDWKEVIFLPRDMLVQRSFYQCFCGSEEVFCACAKSGPNKLPTLSDYFKKVGIDDPIP